MGLASETNIQFIIITEIHSSWMLVTSLICLTSQTHSSEEIVWVWLVRLIQYHSGCYFISLIPTLVCNEHYVAHLHSFYVQIILIGSVAIQGSL